LGKYKNASEVIWAQEEPKNMGAWGFVNHRFEALGVKAIHYIGRSDAASPAVGYLSKHNEEQKEIVKKVYRDKCHCEEPMKH
jgi:2-oxoglutarate dehydrogenase E1 component